MSTRIGLISGPGVKLNRSAPTPSTKSRVSTPRVAPMPSTFMITAFAGMISEPKTSAMSTKLTTTM